MIKQHGALLAKGRIAGIHFDTMFTDDLYWKIGENGIRTAEMIREALKSRGYKLWIDSPTNQVFVEMTEEQRRKLEKSVEMGFMENLPDGRVLMRFATSWATTEEDVLKLTEVL